MRNGTIFHMPASTAWARNLAIRVLGESLLDVPWLYKGINP
jgi:salicylate hydroxylase